jgi:hypothetical protein
MNIFLNTIKKVNLLSLNIYVGHDLLKPIIIHEIDNPIDPDFATAMSVYQKAFPPGLMTIETREFVQALNPVQQSNYTYHLWAIRATESSEVEGMASFFSFPKVGFGGYVAFEGSLKGTWRIKLLIARMEQQMLRDRHPNDADGWYVETNLPNNKSIFSRLGFYEVNINYEQPFLESSQSGLQMRLFYKPYGRVYEVPKVRCTEFLDSISQIFKVVYGISTPQENSSYKKLEAQIPLFADDLISFY